MCGRRTDNTQSWLDCSLGDQANSEEGDLDTIPKQRNRVHKQLNAWKRRDSWSHSLAKQESWHKSLDHRLCLVNRVGLARGWTLASFWLERSRGGCDHLFYSGCHWASCTFCCKGKQSSSQVLGKDTKQTTSAFILPHFFFNLPISSPHSAPPATPGSSQPWL